MNYIVAITEDQLLTWSAQGINAETCMHNFIKGLSWYNFQEPVAILKISEKLPRLTPTSEIP